MDCEVLLVMINVRRMKFLLVFLVSNFSEKKKVHVIVTLGSSRPEEFFE